MYLVNSKCKLQAILEIWLLYIFPFAICTEESHVILLAIDRHLNCSPCQNRWHFTKTSFWLFLSITLRLGKYHKVLFVNILFKTEQMSFISGLLNLSYSLCMNLMQCWMFDNILSGPSCNPILHSHILRIHWIPNLSSSKIRLVRWFPGSLIQIVALCSSHLHNFFFIASKTSCSNCSNRLIYILIVQGTSSTDF
jgi:hypothetical protein